MAVYKKNQSAYGIGNPRVDVFNEPIVATRVPTVNDRAEIGTVWCYKDVTGTDNVYILTSIVASSSNWTNCGGGSGNFDAITVNPGDINVTAGDVILAAGDVTLTTGAINVAAYVTAGVVVNSAAGLLATSAGTDGQVLIGSTGLAPAWSTLTAGGGITITEAAGTITITNPGATGTTFGTDAGGPVDPTVAGLTTFEGYDVNITTDGATLNTVRIRLADDIVSVASITATNDLDMLAGTCTIVSDDNAANAIYLHANAGVNEAIHIHADQGTANDSVYMHSDVGGVAIGSGLAAADSISLNSADAAGGIDIDFGTGGMTVDGANGAFTLQTGTAAILLGVDAVAKDVSLGNATGASSLTLASGTGNLIATSTDDMTLDAIGVLELNSSGGIIGIGNDAIAQNINIGTGGAQRVVTVGNTTGASQVVLDCGTAGVSVGASANAHTTTVGSTNTTSALTLQTGTGAYTQTVGGIWDVNAVGAVTIDSTGGALSIGANADAQNIAIGTGGAQRIITVGNATAATSVVLNSGTGNIDIGVNAIAHTVRVGGTTGASALTLQAGTGNFVQTAGGTWDVNAVGAATIDSTGAAISIGSGADAFGINIGDGAAQRDLVIGNNTGTTSVNIYGGTGDCTFGANPTDHTTNVGSTNGVSAMSLGSGTGGIALVAGGNVDIQPATGTAAANSITLNGKVTVATLTGQTTATTAQETFTITNSEISATSGLIVTVGNTGAADARMTLEQVKPAAGSVEIKTQNNGGADLAGDVIISIIVLS